MSRAEALAILRALPPSALEAVAVLAETCEVPRCPKHDAYGRWLAGYAEEALAKFAALVRSL